MTENETVESLASEYPKELRLALESIEDSTSFAVLMVLMSEKTSDNGGLERQELSDTLDVDVEDLDSTLSELQTGGLIKKLAGEKLGVKDVGEYQLTTFGLRILDSVYAAGDPTVETEEIQSISQVNTQD